MSKRIKGRTRKPAVPAPAEPDSDPTRALAEQVFERIKSARERREAAAKAGDAAKIVKHRPPS